MTLVFVLSWSAVAQDTPKAIAERILVLCNLARQQAGLRPLSLDARLEQAALLHSQEMDEMQYFGHRSPLDEYATVARRLSGVGVYALTSAENLHREQGYSSSAAAENAVRAWLASPVHRQNLLNPRFNMMGLGVVQHGDQITITQDLAYEALDVVEKQVVTGSTGFHVTLRCRVYDGTQSGAIFFQGRRCANWSCDLRGEFRVEVDLPGPGTLAIGQAQGERNWKVETELPIQ